MVRQKPYPLALGIQAYLEVKIPEEHYKILEVVASACCVEVHPSHLGEGSFPWEIQERTFVEAWAYLCLGRLEVQVEEQYFGQGGAVEVEVAVDVPNRGLDQGVAGVVEFGLVVGDYHSASRVGEAVHVGRLDHQRIQGEVEDGSVAEKHCAHVVQQPLVAFLAPSFAVAFGGQQTSEAFSKGPVLISEDPVLPSHSA
jgi:hypothetical protein